MSLKVTALLVALLVCSTLGCAASGADVFQTYSNRQILDYYEYLAFGAELETPDFGEVVGTHILKRDQGRAVKVVVLPQPSVSFTDPALAETESVLGEIVQRSGGIVARVVSMDEVAALMQSEEGKLALTTDAIMLFIGNRQELMAGLKKAQRNPAVDSLLRSGAMNDEAYPFCLVADPLIGAGSQVPSIRFSMVWIETGPALRECLYEELMQSFGLARDFPDGVPSIFSDDRVYAIPSELDWVLWRIHTDPSIVTGMDIDHARAAGNSILTELRGKAASSVTPQ